MYLVNILFALETWCTFADRDTVRKRREGRQEGRRKRRGRKENGGSSTLMNWSFHWMGINWPKTNYFFLKHTVCPLLPSSPSGPWNIFLEKSSMYVRTSVVITVTSASTLGHFPTLKHYLLQTQINWCDESLCCTPCHWLCYYGHYNYKSFKFHKSFMCEVILGICN